MRRTIPVVILTIGMPATLAPATRAGPLQNEMGKQLAGQPPSQPTYTDGPACGSDLDPAHDAHPHVHTTP